MDFGEKLKLFAIEKFGSLTNLATALGMSIGHLSQYVNGVNKPGMDFFVKLKALGCDINWLLSDTPDPPPETNQLLQARLKELEEENQRLRDSISRFLLLAQEVKHQKKRRRKPKK